MVQVMVGDQYVGHSLAGQGGLQGVEVLGQVGARIDHRHLGPGADQIGLGPGKGEGSGIAR
jgi:hypothetical protein